MNRDEFLIHDLPDPEAARRFLDQLTREHPTHRAKLQSKEGLFSDVLTLVSFSPLLAATLLQNPDYIWWLNRKRSEYGIRRKEDLLESLARFSLTNSQLDAQTLFARFRRRELLRIYLRDIRRLATVSEVTEEISNLADAILESALDLARREMDNRFGSPQQTDEKGRSVPSHICVAALGKLGSCELNYSSDIDLIFLYSKDGKTSGSGTRGSVTNREYFVKLVEFATKLIGQSAGEGAAYRVDLRLRPHGSLGALAMSVSDTVRYYETEARDWERQVMIRSRGCAGEVSLFREFFAQIENVVFSTTETVDSALANVRRSKEQINLENVNRRGYDVKLGRGGIREIEFLAQALQLAYGGDDRWVRSPHTLVSLARLADRHHLGDTDLTDLSSAYEFLRRTEHVLQMENGLQTHVVPDNAEKRDVVAKRVMFPSIGDFEARLEQHTGNVNRIFSSVFGEPASTESEPETTAADTPSSQERARSHILDSIEKSEFRFRPTAKNVALLDRLTNLSPHFAAMLAANPHLANELPDPDKTGTEHDYMQSMLAAVEKTPAFGARLSAMRRLWSRFLLEIVVLDLFERITIGEARRLQTLLAEASIAAALKCVRDEIGAKLNINDCPLDLAVLALGKLGGRGLDYGSDLDLILVFDDTKPIPTGETHSEYYSRAAELFVSSLSSMTRDGNLYRVDLRLRPYGSKGLSTISSEAFLGYMRETAVVWEMLAFVKLRAVGGESDRGNTIETESRRIIHSRATNLAPNELRDETRRVRLALEKQRARSPRGSEIDIKYGEGGMLDIYFAMRFLQLRDSVADNPDDRSTSSMLTQLRSRGSLTESDFAELSASYEFLSTLDHTLRLTVGRTTRVPLGNRTAIETIATRMKFASVQSLLEALTFQRLAVRAVFERIVGK